MTFLQPFMLWGLLLGLLPILIHLFNRLRHRKLPWAAMMFLRMANRKSTKYAKVRQWLVLFFRMLAVLALIFALSRPLAGGWPGRAPARHQPCSRATVSQPIVVRRILRRSATTRRPLRCMSSDNKEGTKS